MKIREFAVETWMNRYETRCAFNLAETCVASLTLAELLAMTGAPEAPRAEWLADLLPMPLTYGPIEGSERLRALVAALHTRATAEQVMITHGAIGANALVHQTLVEPGDRVVAVLPNYQQHYSIPESLGADVRVLWLRPEDGFRLDLDALRALAVPGTRLIALSNPNNPTGAVLDADVLADVVDIARACGAWLLGDEVYRGTAQAGDGFTPSVVDLYERGISTGSLSKTFSLAGLRLGWIVAPTDLVPRLTVHRDYTTISVGRIDDYFGTLALEAREAILARSRAITRGNLAIVADWIAGEPQLHWVAPRGGTTALLQYDLPVGSEELCVDLLERTGVMLTPGSAFDMDGWLRLGYCNHEPVLREGLARMSVYLRDAARRFGAGAGGHVPLRPAGQHVGHG